MHKVFITYHHANDQWYKEKLLQVNEQYRIFIDRSVHVGDISDDFDDQTIRRIIRDEYLRDSTVTILLVGTETSSRKHVDWELYSSMINGTVNKKSGVLVINLPTTGSELCEAGHGAGEKARVYPEISSWGTIKTRAEYQNRFPFMPHRIIDNLLTQNSYISVVPWHKAVDPSNLGFLVSATFEDRNKSTYDFSRDMIRRNSN